MTTNPLTPMPKTLAAMPDPRQLELSVMGWLEAEYQRARAELGAFTRPEDTFEIQRGLARVFELFKSYAAIFTALRKRVALMQEEQLTDAVGEVASTVHTGGTGQPNQGLTVPDAAGDIRLSLDMATSYTIDLDQLVAAVVAAVVYDPDVGDRMVLVEAGIRSVLGLGKFEPQVTKVRAYASELARGGSDTGAAVVNSAIRKTSTYRGVKFERK